MATFRGMDLAVGVEGIPQTTSTLRRVLNRVTGASAHVVRGSCARIVYRAKALAPVDTGALRRSITYRLQGTRGYVGCTAVPMPTGDRSRRIWGPAYYWRFVEFGTRYVTAKPFFRPAAEAERGRFKTEMLWSVRNAVDTEVA